VQVVKTNWRLALASLLLGAASVLGYAPFYLYPVSILALAAAALIWSRAERTAQALLFGFAFGLGFFGAGVSWVYVSLHDFGGMPMPIAAVCTLGFCALLASFPAAVAFLLRRFAGTRASRLLLFFPAAWTVAEWVRGWIFTGFPWLALGYSQIPGSPLAGFAPVVGAYGVSLVAALASGALAMLIEQYAASPDANWAKRLASFSVPAVLLLGSVVLGAGLLRYPWTTPETLPTTVALLQGNVPQELKWRPERARQTLELYLDLVRSSSATLTLLPETALPMFNVDLPEGYLEQLAAAARRNNGDLLTGIPEYAGPGRFYNSVISVGTSPSQVYRKVHLVPFGDYFPLPWLFGWFMNLLDIPMSDFSRGAPDQRPLQVARQRVAVNICYEDVFGEEIIRQLPEATLLANFTNDAWWGRSLGARQHLQLSQMRALETGRYMLRATNTGVTAIIDPKGRVTKAAAEFEVALLAGEVRGHTGATPFVRWGNGAAIALAGAMAVLHLLLGRRREPQASASMVRRQP
jgi:apolipoprotein N-acyltransferase